MRLFRLWGIAAAGGMVASLAVPGAAATVGLDRTFSDDGKAYVAPASSRVDSVVDDGDFVYAAGTRRVDGEWQLFVSRLDSDGRMDPTFAGDGRRIISTGGRKYVWTGLAVDSSSRPVVVSQTTDRVLVVRLTAKGRMDRSFSEDGRRTLDSGLTDDGFFDPEVVVDSQGRVVVAATSCCSHSIGCSVTSTDPYPTPCDATIWRVLPDGQLDLSWAKAGERLVHNVFDFYDALAVDAEDRVLLASDSGGPATVLRFTVNGRVDSSFSGDGVAKFKLNGDTAASVLRIGVDPSGTITVAVGNARRDFFGAGRLTSSGLLDVSYGVEGTVTRSCSDGCKPSSADVDDGRVAIVVDPDSTAADRWFRLARVNAAGTRVNRVRLDPFPSSETASALSVEIDEARVLFGGRAHDRGYVARVRLTTA